VVGLLVAALATSASAHQGPQANRHRVDLVSSAQPSAAHPVVTRRAYGVERTWGRAVAADAVATSSATCDGCRGTARTVQVIDAGWARHVRADNVATAWSTCKDCGSDVISVQVVLTHRATGLRVDNRALAFNAGCTGCATKAEAYQVVLTTHRWVDLYALRDEIVAWVDAAASPPAASPQPRTSRRSLAPRSGTGSPDRLAELELLAGRQTGGRVVRGHVQVRGRH
jgi:hypothetical protein